MSSLLIRAAGIESYTVGLIPVMLPFPRSEQVELLQQEEQKSYEVATKYGFC